MRSVRIGHVGKAAGSNCRVLGVMDLTLTNTAQSTICVLVLDHIPQDYH